MTNINEIKSYINHFTRKDQLRFMRFGTTKPFEASENSYIIQTNNLNNNSGFWTEFREDNFLYRIEYESYVTPGRALTIVIQSSGNTFVPPQASPVGFEGLKKAIAFVFNVGMGNE